MGKFELSKGKSFGQCTKMGYDMLYTLFFAIMFSGRHDGTVGQLVNTQQHVSLCPKGGKVLFKDNTVGVLISPYVPIIRRTNRAFNKSDNFIRIRFYSTSFHDSNYDELTKHECGNHFETVEL